MHAQQLLGRCVEAAVGVEAGAVDGVRHRSVALAQFFAQLVSTGGRGIGLWRQARFGLEHTVEVEGTQAQLSGQFVEGGRCGRAVHQATGLGHQRCTLFTGAGLVA
ncbi:hypothetical protein D3C76_1091630 [compost metagenome]